MSRFLSGLRCLRCGAEYPAEKMLEGCPRCRDDKGASNVSAVYDLAAVKKALSRSELESRRPWMWKYSELLPVSQEHMVSLNEMATPLVQATKLGRELGLPNLYLKDESRNPTGSFKDRLCAVAISKGLEYGVKVVTNSSTGNHGAATAAYSSAAGLDCVIFTVASVPLTMKTIMQVYGAKLVATPTPDGRWAIMSQCIRRFGWYPTSNYASPPVGSNPYGIEGYKTIAFEICEQLGWRAPDRVVLPVAYADGLYGTWKGFEEFRALGFIDSAPKMVAAEIFGPLNNAMGKNLDYCETVPTRPTVAFSIGGNFSNYQGLKALRDSGGRAVSIDDNELLAMQKRLGRYGIYAEASSVATLVAIKDLVARGEVDERETVVAVLTATGLRDPGATAEALPAVPVVEPEMDALKAALKSNYGFSIE